MSRPRVVAPFSKTTPRRPLTIHISDTMRALILQHAKQQRLSLSAAVNKILTSFFVSND